MTDKKRPVKKEAPETEEGFEDPLAREQRLHGPLIWAALIFVPIIITIIFTLLRPAPPPAQNVTVPPPGVSEQETRAPRKGRRNQRVIISEHIREDGMIERQEMTSDDIQRESSCPEGLWEGRTWSESLKNRLEETGVLYRVLKPGEPYTKDHKPVRLNFNLNENGVIIRTWCG